MSNCTQRCSVLVPACRVRLDARREEAKTAAAAVHELTEQERKLEGEVEEAGKAVRGHKEEADALKDSENADAQHVQVCYSLALTSCTVA